VDGIYLGHVSAQSETAVHREVTQWFMKCKEFIDHRKEDLFVKRKFLSREIFAILCMVMKTDSV